MPGQKLASETRSGGISMQDNSSWLQLPGYIECKASDVDLRNIPPKMSPWCMYWAPSITAGSRVHSCQRRVVQLSTTGVTTVNRACADGLSPGGNLVAGFAAFGAETQLW